MSVPNSVPNTRFCVFSPFPRLPKELRASIWALASEPRVLTIQKHFSHDKNTQYLYSVDPVPAVLHTCQESRSESPYAVSFMMGKIPRYIWVNFNLDTIQMQDYILRHIKPQERDQIRRIIFEVDDLSDFDCWIKHDVAEMKSLRELTIYTISDLSKWIEILESFFFFLENAVHLRQEWEGWSRPIFKVIERKTGEELDSQNFPEKSISLMARRESENGYGWEDDDDWERNEQRIERRGMEIAQRNEEVLDS